MHRLGMQFWSSDDFNSWQLGGEQKTFTSVFVPENFVLFVKVYLKTKKGGKAEVLRSLKCDIIPRAIWKGVKLWEGIENTAVKMKGTKVRWGGLLISTDNSMDPCSS